MLAIKKFPHSFTAFVCQGSTPTTDSVEHGRAALDDFIASSSTNEELLSFSGFRPAENRGTYVEMSALAMFHREASRKASADRAAGRVNGSGR
jgi:hypothetical protein